MNPLTDHNSTHRLPERLPGTFEPSLRQVDELLSRHLDGQPTPAGLSRRVFEASVAGLKSARPPLRLAGQTDNLREPMRLRMQRLLLHSRLGLAACAALAFVVGAMMLTQSPGDSPMLTRGDRGVNLNADMTAPIVRPVALTSDAQEALAGSFDGQYNELSTLMTTQNVTLDDLANDLVAVLTELEM